MPPSNTIIFPKDFKISKYVLDHYDFSRLRRLNFYNGNCDHLDFDSDNEYTDNEDDNEDVLGQCFCNMNYEKFVKWNIDCFYNLSTNDKFWIKSLCERCELEKLGNMDMESCAEFTAQKIFFNPKGRLVITNPR